MSKKSLALLLLLVVSPVAVYFFWPSDEVRIRKLVRDTAAAVEAEDLDRVMSSFDFAYIDAQGLSYLLLKKTLKREFMRVSDIEVEYEGLAVAVRDKKARAALDLRVIATMGESRGYYIGDFDTPLSVSVGLIKTPTGKWLVSEAEYASGRLRFKRRVNPHALRLCALLAPAFYRLSGRSFLSSASIAA